MAIELTHVIQASAEELDTQINAYLASLVPGEDADPDDGGNTPDDPPADGTGD